MRGDDFELEAHTLTWTPHTATSLRRGYATSPCVTPPILPSWPLTTSRIYTKTSVSKHGNDVHKASRPYHFIEFGTYLYLPFIFCRLNYKVMLFSCVSIGHAQLGNTSTFSFLCVYCFNSLLLPLLYIVQDVLPLTPTHPPPPPTHTHTHTHPPHKHTHPPHTHTHTCRSQ